MFRSVGYTASFLFCGDYKDAFIWSIKVNVKFFLEQAMKAQRGVEVLLYFFFNPGTR